MCIKGSDNRGIWTKDLKLEQIFTKPLNKVLKSLETTKKLIKSVRNVKNPTRKVYMLIGLSPSTEITGGPWFSETELDVEFINELCRVILRFIVAKGFLQMQISLFQFLTINIQTFPKCTNSSFLVA